MQPINFTVRNTPMEHPDKRAITKLRVKNQFIGIFFLDRLM